MANNNRKATTNTAKFATNPTNPINNLIMRPLDILKDITASIIPIIDRTLKILIIM